MPQPTAGDVHVNRPLTDMSFAYMQDQDEFANGKLAPVVPSAFKSNTYYKYDKEFWFRSEVKERAPGAESAGGGYELSTDSYTCKVYALHKDVADQERANQDEVLDLDTEAMEYVSSQLMLNKEGNWVDTFFATSTWTGSSTGSDITVSPKWDAANSTPIEDMEAEMLSVKKKTGKRPNKCAMGEEVWSELKNHPDFLERIKYTKEGLVGPELLASLLGLEEVVIAGGVENTAAEGATVSMNFFAGDDVLLAYVAPSPGRMTPSAMYTFAWTGYAGTNALGVRINRFRMDANHADRIEGEQAFAHKVVAADLGAFFNDVLS